MKKIFIITFLFLLFFVSKTSVVKAVCKIENTGTCIQTQTTCDVNGAIYCCNTNIECLDLKNDSKLNTYECVWNQTSKFCVVDTSSISCKGGYSTDPQKCLTIGKNECKGRIIFNCVSGAQPTPTIKPLGNSTCNNGNGINTAIGCIPVKTTGDFMGWILGWAVGVGGGIAFLLIIYASFMVMTSQNNPERLKAGQELLTSAISGLILLIFSVFILRFIGVDILKLDNFGFGK